MYWLSFFYFCPIALTTVRSGARGKNMVIGSSNVSLLLLLMSVHFLNFWFAWQRTWKCAQSPIRGESLNKAGRCAPVQPQLAAQLTFWPTHKVKWHLCFIIFCTLDVEGAQEGGQSGSRVMHSFQQHFSASAFNVYLCVCCCSPCQGNW